MRSTAFTRASAAAIPRRALALLDETDEQAEEAQALTSTLGRYITGAWRMVEPRTRFVPSWHIDAVAEHLEAAYRREITRLIINIPPRHMKSLAVCVFWPTWIWTQNPSERIIAASYGRELAVRDAVKSRSLIQSPWYRMRWGHLFGLSTDQNVKHRYDNDQAGFRMATSVGGSATGEGGDILIVDDPLKMEESDSEAARNAVINWWSGTWATRLNDLETGVKVVIMQRLHERDLTGHILDTEGKVDEGGEWTHLCLPAEFEPSHPFVWPDDPRVDPGELLWAEKVPAPELVKLKRTLGSLKAAGQLQQRPAPAEGNVFKNAWWRFFDPEFLQPPSPLALDRIVQSWDTAWKDKTSSDYVVGAVWGAAGANRYLLREVRGQMGLTEAKRAIRETFAWVEQTYPRLPHTVLVENTANGPEIVAALRNEIGSIVVRSPRGDKMQRAQAVTPQIEAGNVYVPGFAAADGSGADPARTPGWVMDWLGEHGSFPNAANDDRVDTTTQVLLYLRAQWSADDDDDDAGSREAGALSAGILDAQF